MQLNSTIFNFIYLYILFWHEIYNFFHICLLIDFLHKSTFLFFMNYIGSYMNLSQFTNICTYDFCLFLILQLIGCLLLIYALYTDIPTPFRLICFLYCLCGYLVSASITEIFIWLLLWWHFFAQLNFGIIYIYMGCPVHHNNHMRHHNNCALNRCNTGGCEGCQSEWIILLNTNACNVCCHVLQ